MKKNLDLPDDLAEALKAIAEAEDRNLNQTIVYACRRYVEAYREHGPVKVPVYPKDEPPRAC